MAAIWSALPLNEREILFHLGWNYRNRMNYWRWMNERGRVAWRGPPSEKGKEKASGGGVRTDGGRYYMASTGPR